jgi:hypothetical protein
MTLETLETLILVESPAGSGGTRLHASPNWNTDLVSSGSSVRARMKPSGRSRRVTRRASQMDRDRATLSRPVQTGHRPRQCRDDRNGELEPAMVFLAGVPLGSPFSTVDVRLGWTLVPK